MISRLLTPIACAPKWGRQMRFIAGPRQSGKTTLAKAHLKTSGDQLLYFNWDIRATKDRHHQGVHLLKAAPEPGAQSRKLRWVCFDEIHKMPKWKDILKSYFDQYEDRFRFVVTGSARLDLFRRSGDSLAGRYFLFRLLPLNLFELTKRKGGGLKSRSSADDFIRERLSSTSESSQGALDSLLHFSGFPEPFLKANQEFLAVWRRDQLDRLIKEDLRDLTRIADLEKIASLVSLLPARIGSPLSVNSMRNDLMVSHETIQNYLGALKLSYFIFEVPSYSKKVNRALKKEKKVYFFDWTRPEDPAKRFENYIACELLGWTSLWSDSGMGDFDLNYVRTRNGQECDFLILKDKNPWLLIEVKLGDQTLPSYLYTFSEQLGKIPVIQLVKQQNVLHIGRHRDYRVSASRFFSA